MSNRKPLSPWGLLLLNLAWQLASQIKSEYNLSKLKARKNPYASKLKKPVTMRLSEDVVIYFKSMAEEAGVPYQSLINLYLRDCLANNRKVQINWPKLG
jgi:predicted DNA binding CopG/RHH family protein